MRRFRAAAIPIPVRKEPVPHHDLVRIGDAGDTESVAGAIDQRDGAMLSHVPLMQRFGGLRLGSYRVEDLTLRVVWPPIVPTDRDQLVTDETALVAAGLSSRETAQRALGLNPVVEEMNETGAGERAGAASSARYA